MAYTGPGASRLNALLGRVAGKAAAAPSAAPPQPSSPAADADAPHTSKVEIYSRRFCADSMRAKGLLDRKHIQYNEYLIDNDHLNNSAMVQRAHGSTSTPQIFVDGRQLGGLKELLDLDRIGELDAMLGLHPS